MHAHFRKFASGMAIGYTHSNKARLLTVFLGVVIGVLVTTTSLGAGDIGATVLLQLHPKMPVGRVVGSDIAHAVALTLLAGAGHWYLGSINGGYCRRC